MRQELRLEASGLLVSGPRRLGLSLSCPLRVASSQPRAWSVITDAREKCDLGGGVTG